MSITFRGTAVSPFINGQGLTQGLFLIENGKRSRVNLYLRRLTVQNDGTTLLTTVMPLVKVSRVTNASVSGIILAKAKFDTTLTSDPDVRMWADSPHSPLVATAGSVHWEQYTTRSHSAAEQRTAWDNNLLPWLVSKSGSEFILKPGQSLYVEVVSPTLATNLYGMNNWFVQVAWEEESLATFDISGVVSLSGSPVVGAKVMVLQADDQLLTNAILWEVKTTAAGGDWNSSIMSGKVGAAFVQHKDGSVLYTAPGSPFLEQ